MNKFISANISCLLRMGEYGIENIKCLLTHPHTVLPIHSNKQLNHKNKQLFDIEKHTISMSILNLQGCVHSGHFKLQYNTGGWTF